MKDICFSYYFALSINKSLFCFSLVCHLLFLYSGNGCRKKFYFKILQYAVQVLLKGGNGYNGKKRTEIRQDSEAVPTGMILFLVNSLDGKIVKADGIGRKINIVSL